MLNKTKVSLLLALTASLVVADDDKLGFVFQMVRHGARAPLQPQPPNVFKVAGGCLTSSGMRQRFLLGTFNRMRYIDHYGLLDDNFNPNQIYAQATDLHRVLQSTYSEFMGLYPVVNASNSPNHLSEGEIRSIKDDRGLPPMKVRRAGNHKEQATFEASINGYQMIPVFSYIPNSIHDYIN